MNKVLLIGRLGKDVELIYSRGGNAMASLNLATDESYIDREGKKVQRTEWHRVSTFGKTAENCANYLGKGSLICVEGSLQTRKWQDKNGQDRYTTEIRAQRVQFLDRKSDNNQGGQRTGNQRGNKNRAPQSNNYNREEKVEAYIEDEMPF